MMQKQSRPLNATVVALDALGGTAHARDLLAADIHPRDVYAARDDGSIIEVTRGVFRSASLAVTEPDLIAVATRAPRAVVCLLSAMHHHRLTDEIPRAVHVAFPRGIHPPVLAHPPLETYHFSAACYRFGVEAHRVDGVAVNITSVAKTVADGFKFRSRVGHDVAVGALREALRKQVATPSEILEAARICRVQAVILPYLEALQ